jgi:hypothetical protein
MLEALKKKGHDVEKLWEQISVSHDGRQVPYRFLSKSAVPLNMRVFSSCLPLCYAWFLSLVFYCRSFF